MLLMGRRGWFIFGNYTVQTELIKAKDFTFVTEKSVQHRILTDYIKK